MEKRKEMLEEVSYPVSMVFMATEEIHGLIKPCLYIWYEKENVSHVYSISCPDGPNHRVKIGDFKENRIVFQKVKVSKKTGIWNIGQKTYTEISFKHVYLNRNY